MKYTEICIFKNKQLVHFFCKFGSYSYEIVINYEMNLIIVFYFKVEDLQSCEIKRLFMILKG